MSVTRYLFAPCLFLVFGMGCQSNTPCPGFCSENQPAMFDLFCAPSALANVAVSGPCAMGDASPSRYASATGTFVAISSSSAGTCHVVLTFSTGFSYVTDVTFASLADTQPPGCQCPSYIAPTQRTFLVDDPDAACIDAQVLLHDEELDQGVDQPSQ